MKTSLYAFLAVLGLIVMFAIGAGARDDFWIEWEREVPSKLSPERLAEAMKDLKLWPVFHHSLKSVSLLNTVELETGSELRFEIEPKGKEWKRFDLYAEALEVIPGKKMKFQLKEDSKKKLTKIFDDFVWEVAVEEATPELKEKGFASRITGRGRAHTAHWRGRVFGTLSPRILMNQVYYVDLVKLGTFESQIEANRLNQAPSFQ